MKKVFGVIALAAALTGCASKQQAVNVANTIVQVGVDICQEAPQLVPPNSPAGSVIGLICPLVDNNAQTIEVLVDSLIWNAMKAKYLQQHGSLPKGMSPVKP